MSCFRSMCVRVSRPFVHFRTCRINARLSHSIRTLIRKVACEEQAVPVTIQGWIKSVRQHKDITFIDVNDGSCLKSIQLVLPIDQCPSTATMGSCIEATGTLVNTEKATQSIEVHADSIQVLGACDNMAYPFKSRKRHPPDYMRQWLHLRPRTNTFSSLLRIRSAANKAIHDSMQELGYCHIHTPILTSNDCEGAGEIFQVQPANAQLLEPTSDTETGDGHFFNVPAYLTVSGQLHLEVCSGALAKVYTFGPTFRAENSRSRLHLSEFYMLEAELAFLTSTEQLMQAIEDVMKSVTQHILDNASDDINWHLHNVSPSNQQDIIKNFLEKPYERMMYTEAIKILECHNDKFTHKATWGCDLHKEHERHLVSHCGGIPVFVSDYPRQLKPFYMRTNDDGSTVAAVDLLAPDVGEICGGSLREERLPLLAERLTPISQQADYEWYLDLRRFGSAPHGGFGIGFERHLQALLGIANIKDCIPFPRFTHNCPM